MRMEVPCQSSRVMSSIALIEDIVPSQSSENYQGRSIRTKGRFPIGESLLLEVTEAAAATRGTGFVAIFAATTAAAADASSFSA